VRRLTATPANMHGYVQPAVHHPCTAWPAKRRAPQESPRPCSTKMVSTTKLGSDERYRATEAEPLAIIPSRLPIAEVVQRLQDYQRNTPTPKSAEVEANRWELWATRQPWSGRAVFGQFRVSSARTAASNCLEVFDRREPEPQNPRRVCEIFRSSPRPSLPRDEVHTSSDRTGTNHPHVLEESYAVTIHLTRKWQPRSRRQV